MVNSCSSAPYFCLVLKLSVYLFFTFPHLHQLSDMGSTVLCYIFIPHFHSVIVIYAVGTSTSHSCILINVLFYVKLDDKCFRWMFISLMSFAFWHVSVSCHWLWWTCNLVLLAYAFADVSVFSVWSVSLYIYRTLCFKKVFLWGTNGCYSICILILCKFCFNCFKCICI